MTQPTSESNHDPSKYKLLGEVYRDDAATGIVLESAGTGGRAGRLWFFTDLTLTADGETFDAVTYDPVMTIRWRLMRADGQPNELASGRSTNPAYVTLAAVRKDKLPQEFKLLRTFVHLGSAGAEGVTTEAQAVAHVWSKFTDAAVKTFDDKELVYYDKWLYKFPADTETTSAGLVSGKWGDCTSFVRLFLDGLRVQGVEQDDDFWVVGPQRPAGRPIQETPVMFVGAWTAVGAGQVFLPIHPEYRWANGSDELEYLAQSPNPIRAGWLADGGYDWKNGQGVVLNQVTKDADDPLRGQNNATPLGIFRAHVLAKVGGVYYDASYGKTFASLKEWEDAAVPFYGLRAEFPEGSEYRVVYLMKRNDTTPNTASEVGRLPGNPTEY